MSGIEYAGKSTLITLLDAYYRRLKLRPHLDDHFSISDKSLSPLSRAQAAKFPDDVKERNQRMQIHYHIDIIRNYDYVLVSGWQIEEAVYTAVYGDDSRSAYYNGYQYAYQRRYESPLLEYRLPGLMLIHVTASDESIRHRMQESPHEYQVIHEQDIPEIKQRFSDEVSRSLLTQGKEHVVLDTTAKTPEQSLDELLTLSEPLVSPAELALRSLPVPDGDYDVRYENGVRKMIPKY